MFSGRLVAINRTGPINQSNSIGLNEVDVAATFCISDHKTLKVIVDYSSSGESVNQWGALQLGDWRMDCMAHIRREEFRYGQKTIDFIIEILHARRFVTEDGRAMVEQRLMPYLLQLKNDADSDCLRFTLEHYEDQKLLHKMDYEEYQGRRGI